MTNARRITKIAEGKAKVKCATITKVINIIT